ncbi:MAG: 50S ribosomal protein L22 [Nitrososphaeria archaeon]
MSEFGYSFEDYTEASDARGSLREVDVSPKDARELAVYLKGMTIDRARTVLQEVVSMKRLVPFRRYNLKMAHHGVEGFRTGKHPVKAAKLFLKLLDNVESVADYKGLDPSSMVLVHVAAYPGRKLKRNIPRAFGRSSPRNKVLVHIEIVARAV